MSIKIYFELFKEKIRKYVHPDIYRQNLTVFENRRKFYSTFLKPNDLVYDVGANLGNRVEVFKSLNCNVVAVEPQKYCSSFLKTKFGNSITLLPVALGDKKDKLTMYINSQSSTLSSLSSDWIHTMKNTRFKDNDWSITEEVEVDTLDNLIARYGKPKFIKIDVEGYETSVLKGLSVGVPLISFEYTTPEQTNKLLECLQLIMQINPSYSCNYSIGENTEFALKQWEPMEAFSNKCRLDTEFLKGFGDVYVKLPEITFS